MFPGESYIFIAAAAGMIGHNWPVFYKFKGEGEYQLIMGAFL
jgi:glycerol-3-phosphate acyltransferase PlsY